MTLALVGLFFAGWFTGVIAEYIFHWIMHRWTLAFHINHHKEYFKLPPRDVALNDLDPRLNIRFFAALLVLLSPLMYFVGTAPVLLFWAGAFWHLVFVYEGSHAVMHYEEWLPGWIRNGRLFRWWKGCHFEHHNHVPTGNYCVTFPLLDLLFGTYVHPTAQSAQAPVEPSEPIEQAQKL